MQPPVQIVGSLNAADGTLLWDWDHPSIPVLLRRHAEPVRDFGERYGLDAFTTRHIRATKENAWQFTALASYLAQSRDVYRGPASEVMFVFTSFGELTIGKR